MKVLVVNTKYQLKGGEDSVVQNEVALLREAGVTTRVLEFSNYSNTLFKILMLPFNVASFNKTSRMLRAYRPDVVHIHNLHFSASPAVLYAIKRHKIPVLMTLHNYRLLCPSATLFSRGQLFLSSVSKHFSWKTIKSGVYHDSKLLTLWMAMNIRLHHVLGTWKICQRFIVLNPHTRELFQESKLHGLTDRMVVKPNFCFAPPAQQKATGVYFLFVGRLSEEKGIAVMLKAFAATGFPLKIAGNGPLRDLVLDYCDKYPNIEYAGLLNREGLYDALNEATALVFPSMWYETFGMVMIEAFATGTPVIASKIGGAATIVDDGFNGLHFEAGNEADLSEKLQSWMRMPEEQKAVFQKNAVVTYNEKYTPQKNASELLTIYNDLIYG